jgi:hypothetical protein
VSDVWGRWDPSFGVIGALHVKAELTKESKKTRWSDPSAQEVHKEEENAWTTKTASSLEEMYVGL